MHTLGNFLKIRRQFLKLKQSDVAQAMGCTVQFVSNCERGVSYFSIPNIPKLAQTLKLQKSEIIEAFVQEKSERYREKIESKFL